ncbi:16S rRNA (cytosine(1402)-N(4))-methyltransferase RsmH [Patescibacteria group bacterium]|nr:16S rRNA (cytosine(1402)-N(4))-methyltransferase RsmH [Patescibacteria group bacterium]MBU0964566.1 16S rRNA (cytosine(1402)-N(4))-methyltransferase RsmH [Patescibacteria group bacterium]
MPTTHIPVLLDEAITHLNPKAGEHYIDCTLGGGGHAEEILNKTSPQGKLLAIDLDEEAIKICRQKLDQQRVIFIQENFSKIKQIYNEHFSLFKVNGILLDLGISSIELESEDRGFSFQIDGPLDMRFDKRQQLTAAEIVNKWTFNKLKRVIQEYGQESGRVASEVTKNIINARHRSPITKTKILVGAVLLAFRNILKTNKEIPWIGGSHPATRTFQALRIAVNDELNNLKKVLPQAMEILEPGGRLAVIAFHSLEDKIVKDYFRSEAKDCVCPPEIPVCRCGHKRQLKIITKKPVTPGEREIVANSRARSAKLRVAEKI